MSDVVLSAAVTAILAKGGSITISGTKAGAATPPTTPPATPPATGSGLTIGGTLISSLPQTGANVIYNGAVGGKELWPGDWDGSGSTENYNANLNGVTCLEITATGPYPFWLPFAPEVGGPQGNTPTFDPTPYSHLTVIMKPTGGNTDTLNIGAYTYTVSNGVVQPDVSTGGTTLPQYAVAGPDANGFITYKVPLTAMKVVNPLYKIILQDSSTPVGKSFAVAYAGFTA